MRLPLGPPPSPRRASLLTRVFHRGERGGSEELTDAEVSGSSQINGSAAEARVRSQADTPRFETRLYLEAREQIKRRAWGRAQRALEDAARRDPDCPAALDLTSVRTIRRALRRMARWPSDVEAHLELGRACFDLDLGEDALKEFIAVQRLAPQRYEGFALAALEYLYRGQYTRALSAWTRARELNPELPGLEEVMGSLPAR
jgi:tetratricopeptide (TPR) repeat protein